MKCIICKHGTVSGGLTNVTLEKEGMLIVVKGVPAQICTNCGEVYLDDIATANVQKIAEAAFQAGVQLEVCRYKAA